MPMWPPSLPQAFPIGTTVNVQDVRVRSEMDTGLPKVRRRFTAAIRTYSLPADLFVLTDEQQATLEDFYTDVLDGGTLTFTWEAPWPTAGIKTFRFVSALSFGMIVPGGLTSRLTTATIVLEELP